MTKLNINDMEKELKQMADLIEQSAQSGLVLLALTPEEHAVFIMTVNEMTKDCQDDESRVIAKSKLLRTYFPIYDPIELQKTRMEVKDGFVLECLQHGIVLTKLIGLIAVYLDEERRLIVKVVSELDRLYPSSYDAFNRMRLKCNAGWWTDAVRDLFIWTPKMRGKDRTTDITFMTKLFYICNEHSIFQYKTDDHFNEFFIGMQAVTPEGQILKIRERKRPYLYDLVDGIIDAHHKNVIDSENTTATYFNIFGSHDRAMLFVKSFKGLYESLQRKNSTERSSDRTMFHNELNAWIKEYEHNLRLSVGNPLNR